MGIRVLTIGFTQTTAESFFSRLMRADATKVIDVRLHNVSQLAGFAKRNDLRYFLHTIAGIGYEHRLELAPDHALFGDIKQGSIDWPTYERRYLALVRDRDIAQRLVPASVDNACLLCTEATPDRCHRRLLAEHLQAQWRDVAIIHL